MDFFNWDCDQLRHFSSVNSSLTYVFHLVDFVDISYLTHFAITSLVTLTELCILLCYEVLVVLNSSGECQFWKKR